MFKKTKHGEFIYVRYVYSSFITRIKCLRICFRKVLKIYALEQRVNLI